MKEFIISYKIVTVLLNCKCSTYRPRLRGESFAYRYVLLSLFDIISFYLLSILLIDNFK